MLLFSFLYNFGALILTFQIIKNPTVDVYTKHFYTFSNNTNLFEDTVERGSKLSVTILTKKYLNFISETIFF